MKTNKGFTLIELLVVIAIIGILSSVVLASLNSARSSGEDARIKANLANARAQAELYYNGAGNNTYGADGTNNVCTDEINSFIDDFDVADCYSYDGAVGTAATGWAAHAQLSDGTYFCVDYTGNATTLSSLTSVNPPYVYGASQGSSTKAPNLCEPVN